MHYGTTIFIFFGRKTYTHGNYLSTCMDECIVSEVYHLHKHYSLLRGKEFPIQFLFSPLWCALLCLSKFLPTYWSSSLLKIHYPLTWLSSHHNFFCFWHSSPVKLPALLPTQVSMEKIKIKKLNWGCGDSRGV